MTDSVPVAVPPPVLDIRDLHVALPAWSDRRHAVKGVSLKVNPREILCIVGESGSGKSMMGKAIMGLLPAPHVHADRGQIMFEGRDLLTLGAEQMRAIRGGRIAMIFQEPMTALNPLMPVGRQIDEVLEVHTDLNANARAARVRALIEDVHLPDPDRMVGSYPHQLSGGQRQRIVIAMALALEPALIIADEPTTALDVTTQAQILHLIKELQRKHGTSVLFITHDFGVVAEIADRVAVMRQGEVVEEGPADDVLVRPQHAYTQALVAAVPGLNPRAPPRRGRAAAAGNPQSRAHLPAVVGVSGSGRPRGEGGAIGQPVDPARISLALVGESGSGKTTMAKCVIGLERPDSGDILLDGQPMTGISRSQMRAFRRDVQMVFQDPFASLNPRSRVGDIIAMGPVIWGTPRDQALAEARELLRLVGLQPEAADRYPHEFSGGQRQRIGIARALAVKPKLVVADEPVSALDVSVQKQVLELLDDLRRKFGLSMLFITHDLRVAATVCEEIAILQRGVIVEQGSTAEIFANPQHPYTQSLLDAVPGRDWISSLPAAE